MRTRRSAKKLSSIHLTEVKSNSTCHSLKLPLALACDRCESKIDITIKSRGTRRKKVALALTRKQLPQKLLRLVENARQNARRPLLVLDISGWKDRRSKGKSLKEIVLCMIYPVTTGPNFTVLALSLRIWFQFVVVLSMTTLQNRKIFAVSGGTCTKKPQAWSKRMFYPTLPIIRKNKIVHKDSLY